MYFEVSREMLLKAFKVIYGVAERTTSNQSLGDSNLLITVSKSELFLVGVNRGLEISYKLPFHGAKIPGSAGVSLSKINEVCRALPSGAVIEISCKGHRMKLISEKSKFMLAAIGADLFHYTLRDDMNRESANQVVFDPNFLKNALEKVSFAMADSDVRPFLNGMLFEVDKRKFTMVATDGHRLGINSFTLPTNTSFGSVRVIVPKRMIFEIIKSVETSEGDSVMKFAGNKLLIITSNLSFSSDFIGGVFPEHKSLIPKNGDKVFVGPRLIIKDTCARVGAIVTSKSRAVKLRLCSNVLQFSSDTICGDHAEESVSVAYTGETAEIFLNTKYLIDILSVISSDNVEFTFSDENSGVLIRGEGFSAMYVVMPVII